MDLPVFSRGMVFPVPTGRMLLLHSGLLQLVTGLATMAHSHMQEKELGLVSFTHEMELEIAI